MPRPSAKPSRGRPCGSRQRRASGTTPVKSAERQAALLDHKTRDFLVRQRTQLVTPEACLRHDTIRAHLSEFGPSGPWLGRNAPPERFVRAGPHPSSSVVAKGIHNVERLLAAAKVLPAAARPAVDMLADQLRDTQERIDDVTARIEAAQITDPLAKRLVTIPGVGVLTASAIAATTPEVDNFHSARDYAAWLGLTPQPHSSGGKERLGRISKAGNRYLRRLLYLGAMAQIAARRCGQPGTDWLWRMLEKKPVKVVAIALANRMARTVWALIRSGESYRAAAA